MQNGIIDLRSDTVTLPTQEMREAMYEAPLGDDVYGEDPTLNELEEFSAKTFAREAALFFPTGTMANQAAIMAHTGRGDEIVVEKTSHVYLYEVGGIALLSGVQARSVKGEDGVLFPEEVEDAIRAENIHFPRTALIALENTHNVQGGSVLTKEDISKVAQVAKAYKIPVHLDGARIFNAAAALGIPVSQLCEPCDSVMFCLSKGLAAPAGSMLVGDKELILKAKKFRKALGGGMRQAGILAAAGIVAIKEMTKRLDEDHENAKLLAQGLSEIPGLELDPNKVVTNIIRFDKENFCLDDSELNKRMLKEGVKIQFPTENSIRMVTHKDVSREDTRKVLDLFNDFV